MVSINATPMKPNRNISRNYYSIRPVPSRPATNTAAMLPTRPFMDGTRLGAMEALLLELALLLVVEEVDAVVVPLV